MLCSRHVNEYGCKKNARRAMKQGKDYKIKAVDSELVKLEIKMLMLF